MDSPGTFRSSLAQVVLAPNPGPMTLDGTNSYLLGGGRSRVLVDPGPLVESHLDALLEHPIELILLTHHHLDHSEAAPELARRTGAPVRAASAELCIGAGPLGDGEELTAAGLRIEVVATPGHTADSVSFWLPEDGPSGAVVTGDTILGRGTTVIAHPDGNLGDYFGSLERLAAFGDATALTAHGPVLPSVRGVAEEYKEHRVARLAQVRAALAARGARPALDDELVNLLAEDVYADVSEDVREWAKTSLRAQLAYLMG